MRRFKDTPIGLIERFQSWNRRLFKISPPKRWKLRLPISRPLLLLGVGMIAVVFVQGGYGKQKEEPIVQNEHLTQTPDTLDLVNRARYAINAITRSTNPEAEYAVYFTGVLHRNPPTLLREIPLYGKFMEGLALMRIMTSGEFDTRPSTQPQDVNLHVDRVWRDAFLRKLNKQGLALIGAEGGRQLAWLAIQYRQTKRSMWKELGEAAIQRALNVAVHQDDYCYLPRDSEGTMPTSWEATFQGWTLQGVTQFYMATGSEAALELAGKLARYLKDHSGIFDTDGRFLARHGVDVPLNPLPKLESALHFHHNGNAMEALMEYALASGESEFGEFVKKCYEYARSLPDSSPLIGFFQEYIDDWPDHRGVIDCETCCVVDMLLTALWMTKAGVGDYWDDIDRYLRNQFAEMQMTSGDWLTRMTEDYHISRRGRMRLRWGRRTVGSVPSPVGRLRMTSSPSVQVLVSCTAVLATGHGRYTTFGRICLSSTTGSCSSIYFSTGSRPGQRYNSYIPYQGKVELKVKEACENIAVRAPEWVESSSDCLCLSTATPESELERPLCEHRQSVARRYS